MTDHRIRDIPFATVYGHHAFGHHYITQDKTLGTADQFMVTVYPHGNDGRGMLDPLRNAPHIEVKTFDGNVWRTAGVAPIGKDGPHV